MWPFAKPERQPAAAFPEGYVGLAVGDIHGRLDALQNMLGVLEQEIAAAGGKKPFIVFLGDYIDRGPHSSYVVEQLLAWKPRADVKFLLGNHEDALLKFLDDPVEMRAWLKFGGMDTLVSYDVRPPAPDASDAELERAAMDLNRALPRRHREFFQSLDIYQEAGDYLFCHAGIDPDRPLPEQNADDLLSIRDRFLNSSKRWSHIVVHGHTPASEPYRDHRRVGLDLATYATGRLAGARFEDDRVDLFYADAKRRSE